MVFKRRLLNAILTVYLPTILVLTIVYATNFFKDFFFEAVVTVNLTSLLVLTTLFISVSGALPQTAYVKMVTCICICMLTCTCIDVCIRIFRSVFASKNLPTQVDIWLIFAQIVPWIEVEHLLIARIFFVLFNICKNYLCSQVLLHTLIDVMRTEGEEGREVGCSCLSTTCLYL